MPPSVHVKFEGLALDPSVEASVHHWIARLETAGGPVHSAFVLIEQAGRRYTAVYLELKLADLFTLTVATSHGNDYAAVANAFGALRQRLLAHTAAAGRTGLARALA